MECRSTADRAYVPVDGDVEWDEDWSSWNSQPRSRIFSRCRRLGPLVPLARILSGFLPEGAVPVTRKSSQMFARSPSPLARTRKEALRAPRAPLYRKWIKSTLRTPFTALDAHDKQRYLPFSPSLSLFLFPSVLLPLRYVTLAISRTPCSLNKESGWRERIHSLVSGQRLTSGTKFAYFTRSIHSAKNSSVTRPHLRVKNDSNIG